MAKPTSVDLVAERYDRMYRDHSTTSDLGFPELDHVARMIYLPPARVLDLGSGVRNSVHLARLGYDVTAYDVSQVAIDKINQASADEGLKLRGEVRDIRTGIEGSYDIVLIMAVLHYFEVTTALALIELARAHTNPRGLNIVTAFTKNSDFYRSEIELRERGLMKRNGQDLTGVIPFYLDNSRHLIKLYEGWNREALDTKTMVPSNRPTSSNTFTYGVFRNTPQS